MLIYLKDNDLNFARIINFDKRWKVFVDITDDGFEVVCSDFDTEPLFSIQAFEEIEELNKFMDKLATVLGALNLDEFNLNSATTLDNSETKICNCPQKKCCTCS